MWTWPNPYTLALPLISTPWNLPLWIPQGDFSVLWPLFDLCPSKLMNSNCVCLILKSPRHSLSLLINTSTKAIAVLLLYLSTDSLCLQCQINKVFLPFEFNSICSPMLDIHVSSYHQDADFSCPNFSNASINQSWILDHADLQESIVMGNFFSFFFEWGT